ncbi:MAG: hypothetical protein NT105_15385 [Verrucomicrobia bacterium]|nr:hypothetical protein [Verrucomicrobiota bacterium]
MKGIVFAALYSGSKFLDGTDQWWVSQITVAICFVALITTPIVGIAALVVVRRSRGRFIGAGMVIAGLCLWAVTAGVLILFSEDRQSLPSTTALDAKIVPVCESYRFGEPVQVKLMVTNKSGQSMETVIPRNVSRHLTFFQIWPCPTISTEATKWYPSVGSELIIIKPGQTLERRYCLNRHFSFPLCITYGIRYSLGMRTCPTSATTPTERRKTKPSAASQPKFIATSVGMIWVKFHRVEKAALDAEIASLVRQLGSGDFNKESEAVEALKFLRSPLTIPSVEQMFKSLSSFEQKQVMWGLDGLRTPAASDLLQSLADQNPGIADLARKYSKDIADESAKQGRR